MKHTIPVPVFVVALLVCQVSCNAQSPASQPPVFQPPVFQDGSSVQASQYPSEGSRNSLIPSKNSLRKFSPTHTGEALMPDGAFNGYSQFRPSPDLGAPGSAENGFHHFPLPFDKYNTWYRPRAATLTQYQRCEPAPFRPRGFGNLFARPCDGFRMEYEPYSLGDENSKYGPAYFGHMPNQQCNDHCTHCGRHRHHCDCDCQ